VPFGGDRHRPLRIAQADEAAADAELAACLLHGHAQDRVEVELRADALGDRSNETFPRERVRKGGRRAGPVERQCGLARDRAEKRQLVGLERAGL
jgi:hypothetical protein